MRTATRDGDVSSSSHCAQPAPSSADGDPGAAAAASSGAAASAPPRSAVGESPGEHAPIPPSAKPLAPGESGEPHAHPFRAWPTSAAPPGDGGTSCARWAGVWWPGQSSARCFASARDARRCRSCSAIWERRARARGWWRRGQ
eukprot:3467467-Prymnesium_polylepis.1